MSKKIIIIIAITVVILLAIILLVMTAKTPEKTAPQQPAAEEVMPIAPPVGRYEFQGIEYEFISVGGPVHDIITGELTEEQVNLLAEKIIADILVQEPDSREITLLFYSDFVAAGISEPDVAEIIWTPEATNVKIIE